MNDNRDELIKSFSRHEVETTEDLIRCLKGPTTVNTFRRALLLFLRGHYSSPQNYMGFEDMSCYVWHPDKKERTLEVEFTHDDDDRDPDSYPGIYVGFGLLGLGQVGIGNYAGNTVDMSGTHQSKEAEVNLAIFHVGKRATDTYELAELTMRAMVAMGPVLAANGGATGFEVMGLRELSRKKPSPKTYYTVAMPVQIKYTLAVTRVMESHRIRRISQLLNAS